jgi:hypothetical protein
MDWAIAAIVIAFFVCVTAFLIVFMVLVKTKGIIKDLDED